MPTNDRRNEGTPRKAAGAPDSDAGCPPDPRTRDLERAASERLRRIHELHQVAHLLETGLAHHDIADRLGTTVVRVQRIVAALTMKQADSLRTDEDATAEEIILRAFVERTNREEMVGRLQELAYTKTRYAPAPFEGAVAGTWEQVRHAYFVGFLTDSEYEAIRQAVDVEAGPDPTEPPPDDVRHGIEGGEG